MQAYGAFGEKDELRGVVQGVIRSTFSSAKTDDRAGLAKLKAIRHVARLLKTTSVWPAEIRPGRDYASRCIDR